VTAEPVRPTPADDDLHPPTSDDPFWTETAWFAFSVPERNLTGFVYPVFRTNQRICSAGVYLWDDTAEAAHEIRYFQNYWHLPLPSDLRSMRLLSGLSYDVLEPLRRYRVRYEARTVRFDLDYEGLFEPRLTTAGDHLDQPCRVRGVLELDGELLDVDGFEMRDKSWNVRSDHALELPPEIAVGSFSYGIREDSAFLVKTAGADSDHTPLRSGWLWRDGVLSDLVSGQRHVQRDELGRVRGVELSAVDRSGRRLDATGTTVNRFAFQSTPSILARISGTRWSFDRRPAWGEDQEWDAGT
jgi:hypothetical protein